MTNSGAPVDLSIIIVSYNSKAETLACLESVFSHAPSVSHEIILIDNASTDGSADAVAANFPSVQLIRSRDNLGFAGGNNSAATFAKGRRLLLLNPDTLVFASSLDALWAFAERSPDRRIWGGRTLFGDRTLNPTSCWHEMTLWSMFCRTVGLTWLFPNSLVFNSEAYGNWQRDTERDVDIVTGCFFLVDHDLWRRLAGFDPQFFMYAEEADLCIRARKLGARPAITPDAEIVHLGGASEVSATEKVIKTHRGRITLLRKHWTEPRRTLGLIIYRAWAFTRLVGSSLLSGPRDESGSSQQKWGEVWRRRAEWLAGYPAPEPAPKSTN